MTTTTDTGDPSDLADLGTPHGREAPPPVHQFTPEPDGTRVDIPLGRRVMVVSDLLLTPRATPSTLAVTGELARALDTWDGPGILIIAGNLFDLTGVRRPARHGRTGHGRPSALARSLDPLPGRRRAARDPPDAAATSPTTSTDGPAPTDGSDVVATLAAAGVEHLGPVDLHVQTGTGARVVRVDPGEHALRRRTVRDGAGGRGRSADTKPGAVRTDPGRAPLADDRRPSPPRTRRGSRASTT